MGQGRGQAYVAVVDSGIVWVTEGASFVTHPDLRKNFRPLLSKNLIPGQGTTDFDDNLSAFRGHGTHVSGIVAATPEYPPSTSISSSNSNSGVTGGCWGCSLGMFKFDPVTDGAAQGITSAVDREFQVVNMSFGDAYANPQFFSCTDFGYQSTCVAIAHAKTREVVLAAASGNRHLPRIQFPARHPDVIAVGGLESDSSVLGYTAAGGQRGAGFQSRAGAGGGSAGEGDSVDLLP